MCRIKQMIDNHYMSYWWFVNKVKSITVITFSTHFKILFSIEFYLLSLYGMSMVTQEKNKQLLLNYFLLSPIATLHQPGVCLLPTIERILLKEILNRDPVCWCIAHGFICIPLSHLLIYS